MSKSILYYLTGFFLVIGFIYEQDLLLFTGLIVLLVVVLGKWWLYQAEKHLTVRIKHRINASYIDKPFELEYTIENRSFLPFPNIQLVMLLHQNIEVEEIQYYHFEGIFRFYRLGYNIIPKSRTTQKLTFHSSKRGNYYVGDLQLEVTDPFHILKKTISVYIHEEIAIYPNLVSTPDIPLHPYQPDGSVKSNRRLLEDRIMQRGAREYAPNDPFSKIDWKQTGKFGQLFTKDYEHTSRQEIIVLVNLKTSDSPIMGTSQSKIERVISTVASLAYVFSTKEISYHIITNAKLAKQNVLYKLNGQSKKDLKKNLLQIAKLQSYVTINYLHTFRAIKEQRIFQKPTIILVSTFLSEEVKKQMLYLKKNRFKVIWINPAMEEVGENSDEAMGVMAKPAR